jgi:AcrR family transcriptional regulator
MAHPNASVRTGPGQITADRILEVTARLLADREPNTVTLDRISREVGVAKTSILWHFGSKKDLFLAVVDRVFEQFLGAFVSDHPDVGDIGLELRQFLRAYAEFLETNPQINTVLMSLLFDRKLGPDVRAQIAEMYRTFRATVVNNYTIDGEPVPEAFATTIIAFVDGVFLQWYVDPDAVDIKAVFDAFLDGFLGRPAWRNNDA